MTMETLIKLAAEALADNLNITVDDAMFSHQPEIFSLVCAAMAEEEAQC